MLKVGSVQPLVALAYRGLGAIYALNVLMPL